MKTEVVMERKLFGVPVLQKSKTGFFSATSTVKAGNKWRRGKDLSDFNMGQWFKNSSTIDFINEIEGKYGKALIKTRGRTGQTWVHPLLFIDLVLAISPKLKIEVYEWLYDNLILFRNDSGDSYKKMCGSLWVRTTNKTSFHKNITNVANLIKSACHVTDWNTASQDQLDKRNKIHNNISLLANVLNNNSEAVRLGILEEKG